MVFQPINWTRLSALPFYCLVLSQFLAGDHKYVSGANQLHVGWAFYRDLKVRREGLDVEYKLSQLIASGA